MNWGDFGYNFPNFLYLSFANICRCKVLMPSMSETNQSRNAAGPVVVTIISGLVRVKSDEEIAAEEGSKEASRRGD